MRKIIGVDIDGVLTAEGKGEDNIWHQTICNYFDLTERKEDVYNFGDAYGLTDEQIEEFMEANSSKIYEGADSSPYAKEVLNRLKKKDFTIILVTARTDTHNQLTAKWLKRHQIPYDELIHNENKAEACQKKGINLFIDDMLANVLAVKEIGVEALLMDMHHNRHYKGEVIRVSNWLEIEAEIENFFEI
ncbi:5' nucleotidase, NT5C type [Natroniella sp. ANB-PHB2]|uniref:5' nucleotidase, NT5C type n=1 Tax=Natroniella sp. ANB-PHB2 TaxID=3384444 RepID=UPI0038D4A95F